MNLAQIKRLRMELVASTKLTPKQRKEANALVRKGFSKKAVIRVFGCSYSDLKLTEE